MRRNFFSGLLGLFLVGILGPAFASPLEIQAKVDKTVVETGQIVTFSVTIAGSLKESPKVEFNSFEGFRVISTGQAQQIKVDKGEIKQALTLTYSLAPTTPGTHTLGPIKIEYQGKVIETEPIEIKVIEGKRKKKLRPRLKGGIVL